MKYRPPLASAARLGHHVADAPQYTALSRRPPRAHVQCEMKRALPSCDVGAVAVARPALLLEPEWGQVLPAAAALTELLGCEAAASAHVQRASALLAQDIPALVQELIRCRFAPPSPQEVRAVRGTLRAGATEGRGVCAIAFPVALRRLSPQLWALMRLWRSVRTGGVAA